MTRRTYTKKQKAEAVGVAIATGVTEAERQTGIPKQTIDYWTKSPEFGHLRTSAREEVADQFWVGIQVGLDAVVAGLKDPDVPLRDKQAALATLYDRHALLTGGATTRSESRDISDTLSDPDLIAAVREAERLTATGQERTPAPAEGTTEG